MGIADTSPDDAALSGILGAAKPHWDAIVAHLRGLKPALTLQWKHYGAKYGWQLKVSDKKRAVLYLIPHPGELTAAMALKDAAVAALQKSALPRDFVDEIAGGKVLPEGRAARITVQGPADVSLVEQLLAIKLA